MKGKTHQSSPPGYLKGTEVAQTLGMSRQNLDQSGLVDAIDSWKVGPARLYRKEDVNKLASWLFVRQGLIALGLRPADYPLNPTRGEFLNAVDEGYFDADCPICGEPGISGHNDERVWCATHGVNEYV